MMAKKIRTVKQTTAEKKMDRYFNIVKVFLAITPIICYVYVTLRGMMLGVGFQEVIAKEANITILFLISMLNPYIAYLLHLMEKKLKEQNFSFAVIHMAALLIAQALTMNLFYFLMLAFLFYKAVNYYQVPLKKSMHELTLKNSFLYGGGSFLIVALSSVCLFATIRLM